MALNLVNTVVGFLKEHSEERFTAREISTWILKTFPEECRAKQERSKAIVMPLTDDSALITQLVAEIGSQRGRMQKKHLYIKTTEGRPRKFYFTDKSDSAELQNIEDGNATNTLQSSKQISREYELYPLLSEYLWVELDVRSKRIDEKRSKNKRGPKGNKWLYPDVVGMEDLSVDWHAEIKQCVKQYSDKKTILWSFEVKLLVNRSNIREVFFQTVSNSSWANYGYLVTAEIEGVDTMREVRMLSGLHGIGLIKLDVNNPSESQILVPARERGDVDWDIASRLASENSDFIDYIKLVRQFYQTGDVRGKDWDGFQYL